MSTTGEWKADFTDQIKLSWPLIITETSQFMVGIIATIICGHIGKLELEVVALANSLIHVTGISVIVGLGTACETLFTQIYGSDNALLLKIVLQRSCIIISLLMLPFIALQLNIEALLVIIGQDRIIAKLAADYILIMIPGIISFVIYIVLSRYLQSQSSIYPSMIIGVIGNVLSIALQYFLVIYLEMDLTGSALAQMITYCAMCLMHVIYAVYDMSSSDDADVSRCQLSAQCLQEWGQFLELAISGLLMNCLEVWSLEAGVILGGILGGTELSTLSMIFQMECFCYMIPRGLGNSAAIKIGQHLGSNKPDAAKLSAKVALASSLGIGITLLVLFLSLKDYVAFIFTNIEDVVNMTSSVIPYLAVAIMVDCFDVTCEGVLRGSGRQPAGAMLSAIAFSMALCIGIPLMFFTSMSVRGLWLGYVVGFVVKALLYCIILYKQDWQEEAKNALVRASENHEMPSISPQGSCTSYELTDSTGLLEKKTVVLTNTQLLLRRGLFVSVCVGSLIVGVICQQIQRDENSVAYEAAVSSSLMDHVLETTTT